MYYIQQLYTEVRIEYQYVAICLRPL